MATLELATKANSSETYPVYLVAKYLAHTDPNLHFEFELRDEAKLAAVPGAVARLSVSGQPHATNLDTLVPDLLQLRSSPSGDWSEQTKEWVARLQEFTVADFKSLEPRLQSLEAHLTLRSYLVGYQLTEADIAIWAALRGGKAAFAAVRKGSLVNVTRWFTFIEETNAWLTEALTLFNASAQAKKVADSRKGGSYDIALQDTDRGVVTRFPPEPSGYLHIGHAKAALLNDYFAHEAYPGGKLICRFDDTNPSKEKEEFQDAIVEDLALMGIRADQTSYSSDYFQEMYDFCKQLLREGKAYADDTDQLTMRDERMNGIASKRREATPEDNLQRFEEMKAGSEEGARWCIRAKISVDNPNKAMRDPVIYRCNSTPHHRTGTQWKCYPTYDFCVPILDSIEGVTHALRTIEYRDRNPQYEWMQKALGLRRVHIWDFARMNFVRTLLSKRKLAKFVDMGHVWGWDDPRFPTIRGIRRRGMTIGALREFILKQGPSRNIVNLDWASFWSTNRRYIDPVAPRHTAIDKKQAVKCHVRGARTPAHSEQRPKHGKNPELGTKNVAFGPTILLEQEDGQSFAQDEEVTLMSWGNAIVRSITHSKEPSQQSTLTEIEMDLNLQGDVKATSKKVTWLANEGQELIPVELVEFDYLITKDKLEEEDNFEDFLTPTTEFRTEAWADENVASLVEGDIIQFERKGYYRLDRPFRPGQSAVFFNIPTGKGSK